MSAEAAAPKPPDKSRRAVILATVGIVVILGVALFVAVSIGPVLHIHLVLGEFTYVEEDWIAADIAIKRLGGPSRAERLLSRYICSPKWMAPRRTSAVLLLHACDTLAVPTLTRTCGDPDPDVRQASAWTLEQIGPEAKAAVPALERLREDSDKDVRAAAAAALKTIRYERVSVPPPP